MIKALLLYLLFIGKIFSQTDSVTITEVMFDPSGSESTDEFIEIYNFSKTQIYDLTNWQISDGASGNDSDKIASLGEGLLLRPGQFGIILDSSGYNAGGYVLPYFSLIPDTARLLTIRGSTGGTLGSAGLSNSTAETVILFKPNSGGVPPYDTISRYTYSLGNTGSFSDEKIVLNNDNSSSNWRNSIYSNGTPGNFPELLLKTAKLSFSPIAPPTGTTVQISAQIKNIGISTADSFRVRFYEDLNSNQIRGTGELIDSLMNTTSVVSGDSITLSINFLNITAGTHRFFAEVVGSQVFPIADTTLTDNVVYDSVQTIAAMDLMVNSMTFSPVAPLTSDSLFISTRIKNIGLTTATQFKLKWYEDLNFNHQKDAGEDRDSVMYASPLNVGDSVSLVLRLGKQTIGQHNFLAEVVTASVMPIADEVQSNNQRFDSVEVYPVSQDIVVNEFLYNSISGEIPEWVEIYNRTNTPLQLKNWKISDASTTATITSKNDSIPANGYALIIQDSTTFHTTYGALSGLKRMYLSSLPTLNNSGDLIKISTPGNAMIDSVRYVTSWGGPQGISVERKYADSNSNSASTWNSSTATLGATPGAVNSNKPFDYDVAILKRDFAISPAHPLAGQSTTLTAKLRNVGLQAFSNPITLKFFYDINSDSIAQNSELIDSMIIASILNGDSVTIQKPWNAPPAKKFNLIAQIHSPIDQNALNNSALMYNSLATPRSSVVINEILYYADTSRSEFIELYNPRDSAINLQNWRLHDASSSVILSASSLTLAPRAFAVFTADTAFKRKLQDPPSIFFLSSMPSLNNDDDDVFLTDEGGSIVDSLHYFDQWGGAKNISLERKFADSNSNNASNWASSASPLGSTPGTENSTTPAPFDVAILTNDFYSIPSHPTPGQAVTLFAKIRNKGVFTFTSPTTVKFFYDANGDNSGQSSELIDSSVINSIPKNDSVTIQTSWTVPLFKKLSSSGTRKLVVQILSQGDLRSTNNSAAITLALGTPANAVVINEIMYDNDTSRAEFVEIYNPGDSAVNLQNWKLHDASSSAIISAISQSVPAKGYAVLTSDTAFLRKFPSTPMTSLILMTTFPSLNNTDDQLYISDDVGALIDSVHYFDDWGGYKNVSLERRDFASNPNDEGNWSTSLAPTGSTPGLANSLLTAIAYARHSVIINEIMFSPFSGEPEFLELFNTSDDTLNLSNWSVQIGESKTLLSSIRILPLTYLVVANTTTFPARYNLDKNLIYTPDRSLNSLSSNGDIILVRDWIGAVIDSVYYQPTWGGGDGRSIEKIKPSLDANSSASWSSCVWVEGGTPGKVNSIFADELIHKIKITADPNPFLYDRADDMNLTIDLPVTQAKLTLKVYDVQGRLIHTLLNHTPSGSHYELKWNGRDKSGNRVRIGIYVLYLEVFNDQTGYKKSVKRTIVVGKRL